MEIDILITFTHIELTLNRHLNGLIQPFQIGPPQAKLLEYFQALPVDHGTLFVHDIVIIQHAFADVEIVSFDADLGLFQGSGDQTMLKRLIVIRIRPFHKIAHAITGESAKQLIFQTQEETRLTRVPLSAGTSAQLIVYSTRFMPLCTQDIQPAGLQNFLLRRKTFRFCFLHRCIPLGRLDLTHIFFGFAQSFTGNAFWIPAQQNIHAAPGHIGSDGDGADATGLRDDGGFSLMLLRIQDIVGNPLTFQPTPQRLRCLDGHSTDQDRLTFFMPFPNLMDHSTPLCFQSHVYEIGLIDANDRFMGGDRNGFQFVDFFEFLRFRQGRSRHSRQFFVHAKVVLEGDRSQGHVFPTDLQTLFGFDGLVQSLRKSSAIHQTTGKIIDDDHLAVLDDIFYIALVQRLGSQTVIQVWNHP